MSLHGMCGLGGPARYMTISTLAYSKSAPSQGRETMFGFVYEQRLKELPGDLQTMPVTKMKHKCTGCDHSRPRTLFFDKDLCV